MKMGVLDIGTNSIHLILVEIRKDLTVDVIDRAKEIIRLGETSFQEGTLSEPAIQRGLAALQRFKKLAEIHEVAKIRAVATSAVREAANGGDFLEMIEQKTGIKVDVITGDEEARLIYLAVKHSIPLKKPSLILDIGGGSVEAIIADESGVRHAWSLKLGTLRLKGEYLRKDPPTKKELQKLNDHILENLDPVIRKIRQMKVATIIGTSGTLANLATMAHWMEEDAPIEILNHFRIRTKVIQALYEVLIQSDRKQRLKVKGIDPTRVELVIPGCAIVNALVEDSDLEDLILCDEAIREGVVYDYLERNRSKIDLENQIPDMRHRSVLQLGRKCEFQEDHAQHVAELATRLFDQTRVLHELGAQERELLKYAALLHDVGYHINYKKHHKHSYYLIKNGDLNGFEEREVEMIANMARYHCKSFPKKGHENWQRLSPSDRRTVEICAGILRIADGLDRSHFSVVHQLQARMNGKGMIIEVTPAGDPELEIWSANKKKDLFEDVLGKKIIMTAARRRYSKKTKMEIKPHA